MTSDQPTSEPAPSTKPTFKRAAWTIALAIALSLLTDVLAEPSLGQRATKALSFAVTLSTVWVGWRVAGEMSWRAGLIQTPFVGAFAFLVRWLLG
jgi:hypothetical protein